MAINYVLIDFENVQPTNLEVLQHHLFKVIVFVGATQKKVPFELAAAMHALGDSAQYIKISGTGKNALDFHIAYYLGKLSTEEPKANFHIISRDTGFDTLVKHLKARNINVKRERDLAEIPLLRLSNATSSADKISAIVIKLAGLGQSRPRKVKTLTNTIGSMVKENLSEQQLDEIVKELEEQGFIVVSNGNVSYNLTSNKP